MKISGYPHGYHNGYHIGAGSGNHSRHPPPAERNAGPLPSAAPDVPPWVPAPT
jgi:hypothetical protein